MKTEVETARSAPRGRLWTKEEDTVVSRHLLSAPADPPFTSWAYVADELPGRTGRQVRDRWNNYLNPAINHEPFTREDDMKLWNGRKELGSRWVDIAFKVFNSTRSENQVKNRWYSATFKKFVSDEFGKGVHDSVSQQQPARKYPSIAFKTLVAKSVEEADKVGKLAPGSVRATDATTVPVTQPNSKVSKPASTKRGGKKRRPQASPQIAVQVTPEPKGGNFTQSKQVSAKYTPVPIIHSKERKGIQSMMPTEGSAIQTLATMERNNVILTPAQKGIVRNVINFPLKDGTAPKGRSWTKEEDEILSRRVLGEKDPPFTRWSDLAASQLPGRTGKQVRDRWNNYLNPAINHQPWTDHEDQRLWRAHGVLGKKWTEIGIEIFHSTRSENQIKNRWYSAAFKKFVAEQIGKDAYEEANQSAMNAKVLKKRRLA